jgi:hypothetical protein
VFQDQFIALRLAGIVLFGRIVNRGSERIGGFHEHLFLTA